MGHLVRDAPEHEALHSTHALVSDHDQIGIHSLRDADERVRHVSIAGTVDLDGDSLALRLGEQLPTRVFGSLTIARYLELKRRRWCVNESVLTVGSTT